MSANRPINADEPVVGAESEEAVAAPKQSRPSPIAARRRRRPRVPGALKAIAALIAVALAFIVAAIVGGSSDSESDSSTSPAPAPAIAPAGAGEGESAPAQTGEELGYPSFATGNTTRVGGSNPAANAAGVSLAVFPSTTPTQRPAAVTLVDEEDWSGAIAASVLMSAPVRAPVLISEAGELPEPTAEALDALDPQGAPASDGSSIFAVGEAAAPGADGVIRIEGRGPAATAAAIAALRNRLFGSPPAHIVLVSADAPELAMPAAAWAARSGDPVLFTAGSKLPQPTKATLKRHKKAPVYVLGPSSAISSAVVREVAKLGNDVRRVSGEDAVTNAIAFARYSDGSFGWNVNDPGHGFVLASADSPLDAAAAAPLSASGTWGPLLLTDSATALPAALREYFLDVKPGYTTNPTRAFYNHVWVIGDQEAIDVNQQAQVNELAELAKIGDEG